MTTNRHRKRKLPTNQHKIRKMPANYQNNASMSVVTERLSSFFHRVYAERQIIPESLPQSFPDVYFNFMLLIAYAKVCFCFLIHHRWLKTMHLLSTNYWAPKNHESCFALRLSLLKTKWKDFQWYFRRKPWVVKGRPEFCKITLFFATLLFCIVIFQQLLLYLSFKPFVRASIPCLLSHVILF